MLITFADGVFARFVGSELLIKFCYDGNFFGLVQLLVGHGLLEHLALCGVGVVECGDEQECLFAADNVAADAFSECVGISECVQIVVAQLECDADVDAEIRAQIDRCKKLGLTNPSHLDNHMGSLYGIETGRFELLNLTLDIAGEYGLPFRFPGTFVPEMFENETLDVKIDIDTIAGIFDKVLSFAKSKGVAMPDYLIPGEWNGPQKDSYENFKEYLYDLYANIPEGVTETYLHPSIETDDLKGTSSVWERRVWEYNIMKDPKTKQHIEAHGIKLINYRDLAEMKK